MRGLSRISVLPAGVVFLLLAGVPTSGVVAQGRATGKSGMTRVSHSIPHKPPDLPANPAGEKELLAQAGSGFRIKRTSHFAIAYDVPRKTLNKFQSRLKATYLKVHRFCRIREIPLNVKTSKLEVTFCDEWSTYSRLAGQAGMDPAGTYGFYDMKRSRSFFCNVEHTPDVVRFRRRIEKAKAGLSDLERVLEDLPPNADRVRLRYSDGRTRTVAVGAAYGELDSERNRLGRMEVDLKRHVEQLNRSVIQHEVAHHVLYAGGVHVRGAANPMWLVEGLAMQFETPPSRPRQTSTTVNHERLREFRRAHERRRLLPLDKLLSDDDLFSKSTPNRAIAYAQAWALVYYLSRNKSDHFAAHVRVLAVRHPGVPVAPDQEQSELDCLLGPRDGKFVSRWEKHILALPHRPREIGR